MSFRIPYFPIVCNTPSFNSSAKEVHIMLTAHQKVCWFATYSRVFVVLLAALANFIIPDHKADAFIGPQDPDNNKHFIVDRIVELFLGGLVRWDAQYFMHVSLYGYTYENCLAFFPLYPMCVRVMGELLYYPLHGVLSRYTAFIFSAVAINFVCFIISASVLYKLTLHVFKDENMAYKASILYCVNPATIFFTAPYSETLFACFTFYGMLKCSIGTSQNLSIGCSIPFGLSAVQRSNGILNIGFIIHERFKYFCNKVLSDMKEQASKLTTIFLAPLLLIPPTICAISFTIEVLMTITPFVMFQGYGYYKFCTARENRLPEFILIYAREHSLKVPGSFPAKWCKNKLPLAYSYIQEHYWDVGFLRYYHWKQIPNFLLALPMVLLISTQAYSFFQKNKKLYLTLGLKEDDPKAKEKETSKHDMSYPSEMFVYVVHATLLTIFCVLCIHVQVTTRMLASATPVPYWFAAYFFHSSTKDKLSNHFHSIANKDVMLVEDQANLRSKWKVFVISQLASNIQGRLIQIYFLSYLVIGILLFSNFYPWT